MAIILSPRTDGRGEYYSGQGRQHRCLGVQDVCQDLTMVARRMTKINTQ